MTDPQKQQQTQDAPPRFLLHVLSTVTLEKQVPTKLLLALNVLKGQAQEKLGWKRICLCSSLTGTPTRVLELYEVAGFDAVARSLEAFEEKNDPAHPFLEQVRQLCETREVELMRQMPYSPHPLPPTGLNAESHFLHVVLTVKNAPAEPDAPVEEDLFTHHFRKVLPAFELDEQDGQQAGLMTLMAAGRGLFGRSPPFKVMHLWRFDDANKLERVMRKLSHNSDYPWFLEHTLQSQDLMRGFPTAD